MSEPLFLKVSSDLDFPAEEQAILEFWKAHRIFEKSLGKGDQGTFVFYEGPPTANGVPHNGHVLTRVMKDIFPRYKTMRGYHVPRKAGWDTHGLPVEVEVEKELRIHGKAAIDAYGMEPFVARCLDSVFRYTKEWEHITERIGFWVDLKDAYVTYHQSYVESVWWALSELFQKGLLYQGHKVVWWWAQGGTALSSAEVGLGYKTVDDPSVFVAFPLKDEPDVALLVWTTTPWTLSSNMYAAVNPGFDYVVAEVRGQKLVFAKGLLEPLSKKLGTELSVLREIPGSQLVGKEYTPPFPLFEGKQRDVQAEDGKTFRAYFRVIAADFVLLDASGIVHVAPAFGEDDNLAHRKELARLRDPGRVELLCAVKADGTFVDEFSPYGGRWVKSCDREIAAELKQRGLLVHAETTRHEYPFCWRADSDPLIQFARPAWYIRTTGKIQRAIENSRGVSWMPPHIRDGRMGDFLENNVDWALSRERYWGTPLNIWMCDADDAHRIAPDSVKRIEALGGRFDHFEAARRENPSLSEHLRVHKPWIDQVTFPCTHEACTGTMKRVPEVIDCWFDSGCMPFAQWGFPHEGAEMFRKSFPADFISEAIDQTRGWFYSLLMISTLVFDEECQSRYGLAPVRALPHPYKHCIVLGHVCDKEGKKESKSKGNYTPPEIILDKVAMEFAVVSDAKVPNKEAAFVAREDLEGLDLAEGATVRIYRKDEPGKAVTLPLFAHKGLRRRLVVLPDAQMSALGAKVTAKSDVMPVEVPRLPGAERVVIEDPEAPAPGADAFRWFFFASSPPWNNTRHSLSNVRALQKEFLIKLRNVYSFFVIYANLDGLPKEGVPEERSLLDRWIVSELMATGLRVTECLDAYDVYGATQRLNQFVDGLSNWYVRRSRDRFWRSAWDPDKVSAFRTLHRVLSTLSRLLAPFVPFFAEGMYRNLVCRVNPAAQESVHLSDWPKFEAGALDQELSEVIGQVRELVSLGLQVRTEHKLRVRQPLRAAHLLVPDTRAVSRLAPHVAMIREELNVLHVHFVEADRTGDYVSRSYKPNFRSLGARGLGKVAQELKKQWSSPSSEERRLLEDAVRNGGGTFLGTSIGAEDIEVVFEAKAGFAASGGRVGVVVLETVLDDALRDLGYVRELQNRIQTLRKDSGLEFSDRIRLRLDGSETLERCVKAHGADLAREVLAVGIELGVHPGPAVREVEVLGETVRAVVERA